MKQLEIWYTGISSRGWPRHRILCNRTSRKKAGLTYDQMNDIYEKDNLAAVKEGQQNKQIREYAIETTDKGYSEYFPEALTNFYCSPQAQKFVEDLHLSAGTQPAANGKSITYNFLTKYLEMPDFSNRKNSATESQDIFVHFIADNPSNPNSARVILSTNLNATEVAMCKGDFATCFAKTKSVFKFKAIGEKGDRRLFDSEASFIGNASENSQEWTLIAVDQTLKLHAARSIQIIFK